MPAAELERAAARWVPGRGVLEFERLGNGLVNETYRVRRDGVSYALRLALADPWELGLDRQWEARILDAAVHAGLAPATLHYDAQRGILISRWVEGRCWSRAEVRLPANIHGIAALARRIHALAVPAPARIMTPGDWIDLYRATLGRTAAASGGALGVGAGSRCGGALGHAAAARRAELAKLPAELQVICHSDLHALNLLVGEGSAILLDWEYAHLSDPFWDLAAWACNNDFEDELRRELLGAYLGRAPTPEQWTRLGLLAWLFDYVCLAWSELYLSLQGAAGGVAARAQWLETRLRASLE